MANPTIYFRMRASKDAKGNWQFDAKGGWRFLPVPGGRGRRPEWLVIAEKSATNGGRGFQFRYADSSGKIQWSDQYRSIDEAGAAVNRKLRLRPSVD
jgi:hypothetical protein